MTSEIILVFSILFVTIILFAFDVFSIDKISMPLIVSLAQTGLVKPFSAFSKPSSIPLQIERTEQFYWNINFSYWTSELPFFTFSKKCSNWRHFMIEEILSIILWFFICIYAFHFITS